MRKLILTLGLLWVLATSYSQTRIEPYQIHYRDESTSWQFVDLGGAEVPMLYFYFNNQTDIRKKLTRVRISNGWKDSFTILTTGVYTREGAGVRWRAADRENVNCTLELVIRKEADQQYTQLYVRYTNIEYVYSFILEQ